MTHQFNPQMEPDSRFVPGSLVHLVPGNRGRMLDPRRTPIRVLALEPEIGVFVCEVLDFEDRGARWELAFEAVSRFQFARGCALAAAAEVSEYQEIVARFDRPLEIACDPAARASTQEALAHLRREAGRWLEAHSTFFRAGGTLDLGARDGDARLWTDLQAFLGARGLWEIEDGFAARYVSHPDSGEQVKGHAVVLAELGLAAYSGKVVRDPATFSGVWSKARRADHILSRLAFVHELFTRAGLPEPVLYRGLASDRPPRPWRPCSFVSASFSRAVAMSLFEPANAPAHGALLRQRTPCERLFMTYLETEQMNRRFHEAEAVLLDQGDEGWF